MNILKPWTKPSMETFYLGYNESAQKNLLAPRREFALDSVPWLFAWGLFVGVGARGVTAGGGDGSSEVVSSFLSLWSWGVHPSFLLAAFLNLDSSTGSRDARLLGSEPELVGGVGVTVSSSGLSILEMALSSPGVYRSTELRQDTARMEAVWVSPSAIWASVHAWTASLLPRKICVQKKSSPSPNSNDRWLRLAASTLKGRRKWVCWGFSKHFAGLKHDWADGWSSGWSQRPSLSWSASLISTVEIKCFSSCWVSPKVSALSIPTMMESMVHWL